MLNPILVKRATGPMGIAVGEYHSLFLDSSGQVRSCGSNNYGELARVDQNYATGTYIIDTIENLNNIISISAASSVSLFLDSSGDVFSSGRNDYGQLGRLVANGTKSTSNLGKINDLHDIVSISTGGIHSLFLDYFGDVWSCGYNGNGQLGRIVGNGSQNNSNLGKISSLSNIIAISAGPSHSLFLNSSGVVYSCGYNGYGQLGRNGDNGSPSTINILSVSALTSVISIAAGAAHSLFLNSSYQAWSCGYNNYGELGRAVAAGSNTLSNLQRITTLSNIKSITTGKGGYAASLFLNTSGQPYSCGLNDAGQLGRKVSSGSPATANVGRITTLSDIVSVAGAEGHSLFLESSGAVLSCGYNAYGQLGRNVTDGSATSVNLAKISSLSLRV
jgi:alpha-tubulin suppressor-like RCC1 family protein